MTTLKRLLALLTALCLCLALAACRNDGADAQPSEDVSSSDSPDAPSAGPVDSIEADLSRTMYEFSSGLKDGDTALTVNGEAVPNEQYFYWMSTYCYNVSMYAFMYGMSADFTEEDLRLSILDNTEDAVAYYAVLRQLCREEGISVTAEQQAELQSLLETQGANTLLQSQGMTQEEITGQIDRDGIDALLQSRGLTREQAREAGLNEILQSCGLTEESFRAIAEDSYLFTNYADHLMGKPTAADLEQYVADQGIFSVKHILLLSATEDVKDNDGNVTETAEEHNAAKRATAEELLAQLQGADDLEAKFDELMNQYSEDGGLATNPDGYTFTNGDSLVGGFREAALALEPGQLSGIVETDYGYHIMLRLPLDAAGYEEDWVAGGANQAILDAVERADISVADAISNLNVADFYNRYMAYGTALYEAMTAAQSGSGG